MILHPAIDARQHPFAPGPHISLGLTVRTVSQNLGKYHSQCDNAAAEYNKPKADSSVETRALTKGLPSQHDGVVCEQEAAEKPIAANHCPDCKEQSGSEYTGISRQGSAIALGDKRRRVDIEASDVEKREDWLPVRRRQERPGWTDDVKSRGQKRNELLGDGYVAEDVG